MSPDKMNFTDVDTAIYRKRGNCLNFLFVSRYRQTPTIQIIIDSPRPYRYTFPL